MGILVHPAMEMSFSLPLMLMILQLMSVTLGLNFLVLLNELARCLGSGQEQFLSVDVRMLTVLGFILDISVYCGHAMTSLYTHTCLKYPLSQSDTISLAKSFPLKLMILMSYLL